MRARDTLERAPRVAPLRVVAVLLAASGLGGCYRTHTLDAPVDARVADAGTDGQIADAGQDAGWDAAAGPRCVGGPVVIENDHRFFEVLSAASSGDRFAIVTSHSLDEHGTYETLLYVVDADGVQRAMPRVVSPASQVFAFGDGFARADGYVPGASGPWQLERLDREGEVIGSTPLPGPFEQARPYPMADGSVIAALRQEGQSRILVRLRPEPTGAAVERTAFEYSGDWTIAIGEDRVLVAPEVLEVTSRIHETALVGGELRTRPIEPPVRAGAWGRAAWDRARSRWLIVTEELLGGNATRPIVLVADDSETHSLPLWTTGPGAFYSRPSFYDVVAGEHRAAVVWGGGSAGLDLADSTWGVVGDGLEGFSPFAPILSDIRITTFGARALAAYVTSGYGGGALTMRCDLVFDTP